MENWRGGSESCWMNGDLIPFFCNKKKGMGLFSKQHLKELLLWFFVEGAR